MALSTRPLNDFEQKWDIFPGERIPWDGRIGTGQPGLTADQIKEATAVDIAGHRSMMQVWLFGCADYLIEADTSHHQTAFVYRVYELVQSLGTTSMSATIEANAFIPADKVLIVPYPTGSGMTN
jgi:hypothetical protein